MSDTPISDSTPHNVAELGMLCRRLERELNASTSEIERLTNKVAQLYEGAEEQKYRIKRLEEAGDEMYKFINPPSPCMRTSRMDNLLQDWDDAKININ
jgi:predicted RNase H-like nuclease (RuvC/YqgF family)